MAELSELEKQLLISKQNADNLQGLQDRSDARGILDIDDEEKIKLAEQQRAAEIFETRKEDELVSREKDSKDLSRILNLAKTNAKNSSLSQELNDNEDSELNLDKEAVADLDKVRSESKETGSIEDMLKSLSSGKPLSKSEMSLDQRKLLLDQVAGRTPENSQSVKDLESLNSKTVGQNPDVSGARPLPTDISNLTDMKDVPVDTTLNQADFEDLIGRSPAEKTIDIPGIGEQPSQDRISKLLADLKKSRETGNTDIKTAMEERRFSDAMAMLTEGAAQAGAGIASQGGYEVKADKGISEYLKKAGERQVADAKLKAKLGEKVSVDAIGDIELETKLHELDPLSDISKKLHKITEAQGIDTTGMNKQQILDTYKIMKLGENRKENPSTDINSVASTAQQDQTIAMLKSGNIAFKEEEIRKLSEDTLTSKKYIASLRKHTSNLAKEREGRLKGQFTYRQGQKFEDDARSALKDMRQTGQWKSAEASMSEIPMIANLLDDAYIKGGNSLAMLGPKVARGIANEVGVLTEQDVTRYVQNPSLVGGLMDTIAKLKDGKISETSYKNLKRLLEIGKKAAGEKLEFSVDRASKLFSKREGIAYEDARHFVDAEYDKTKVEKIVKTFMSKNPKLSKKKAIEVLRKYNRIK